MRPISFWGKIVGSMVKYYNFNIKNLELQIVIFILHVFQIIFFFLP
jgi:hypothetical protein